MNRRIKIYDHKNGSKIIDKKIFNQIKFRLENIEKDLSLSQIKDEVKEIFIKMDFDVPAKNLFPGTAQRLTAISLDKKIGVCHQNGHFGLAYYDFAKIEFLYKREIIDLAIFICPREFSTYVKSNATTLNRIKKDFLNFKRNYNIPIIFIGVE